MNHREVMNRVFAKLGNEKVLLDYQAVIGKILGIVIDFINTEGVSLKLSRGKHFHPLCDYLRRNELGCRRCHECDRGQADIARLTKAPRIYSCYAGFTEIVVPLFDGNEVYLGCMTAGQFHIAGEKKPSPESFAALAAEIGEDAGELARRGRSAVELTRTQVEGLIEYLKLTGNLVVGTYGNLMFMESVNTPDKMQYIQKYIHENYMKPLGVAAVAKKFYFSPNYFSRSFHRAIGVTFNTYLNCYRIDKAREMLRETELSVAEIAFLTGFGSVSQFNRVFRNVANKTPREFRNAG